MNSLKKSQRQFMTDLSESHYEDVADRAARKYGWLGVCNAGLGQNGHVLWCIVELWYS